MQIIWRGHSCFQIFVSPEKNSKASLILDPFDEKIGLKLPKLEADIVLVSHCHYDHNNFKAVLGSPSQVSSKFERTSPFLIEGPGEYEVKNVYIEGIPSWHDEKQREENTIYTIEAEEIKICHLGDLGQKELQSEQLERIGQIDILMIPVGGIYTISGKEAIKVMSQIEPRIIIPMHYALPKLKMKLDGVEKFLKLLGIKKLDPLPKLSIKKKEISEDEAKIILLKS